MTTLTVREVVYYSAQLQLPDSMSLADKRKRAEETVEEMGLTGSSNTRIGGWAHKGISGGQKRRVSICMEILTRPELLFLDEPTSGLDSAASYHVMSRIAKLARREGMTVVAAIHQPSSEVFELFHELCLLAYGKTVYFGPAKDTSEVLIFFINILLSSSLVLLLLRTLCSCYYYNNYCFIYHCLLKKESHLPCILSLQFALWGNYFFISNHW